MNMACMQSISLSLISPCSISSSPMKHLKSSLLFQTNSLTKSHFHFFSSRKNENGNHLRKGVVQAYTEELSDRALKEGIATFYDSSSTVWEEMWGEHMHHGYYPAGEGDVDHKQAQIDMIENTLSFSQVSNDENQRPRSIVDVGCGIGGSSRYLCRKYDADVTGITLSPFQASRANQISKEQNLHHKVSFQVADALNQPFENDKFDLVWSMESGEHMPDKRQFVRELTRVAMPGGRIIIVTWCHRDLDVGSGETSLLPSEQKLLNQICDAYYLPAWCSTSDYVKLAKEEGLIDIKSDDWTQFITPFWPAVISSALSIKGIVGLAKSGFKTIRGALAMVLMIQGYNQGLIKFAIITAKKPLN